MNTQDMETGPRLELRRALMVVRRRWWLVALCALAVTGAAYVFSKSQQQMYTTSTSLLLQDSGLDQVLLTTPQSPQTVDPTREAETNIAVVSSPAITRLTASALHVPVSTVTNAVSVSAEGQTNVVSVKATDPSPRFAAVLANEYAAQAIAFRRQSDRTQVLQIENAVAAQLAAMTPAARASAFGQLLQTRSQDLQLLADAQTGSANVIQAATIPTAPSLPRTKRNVILGLLFGLLLGLGAAFLAERLSKRVRVSQDFADLHQLPVLVDVPQSRALKDDGGAAPLDEVDREPFRMLVAKLRYANGNRDLRSVLVTSAGAKEGKSTVSWNLAAAAALGGTHRVLLVEADLRRPALAPRHGLRSAPGLADILSHHASLREAIQTVAVEEARDGTRPSVMDVIVGGQSGAHAATLMESRPMAELLQGLSAAYDFVVLDTASILLVADAIPLIRLVDGVVVVSRVGVTTTDQVATLREQLRTLSAPTVGLIANGVKPGSGQFYGYYSDGVRQSDGHTGADAGLHNMDRSDYGAPEVSPGAERLQQRVWVASSRRHVDRRSADVDEISD